MPCLNSVAAVVGLEGEVVGDRLGELLRHLRADVLVGEHRREAQRRLVLRHRGERDGSGQRGRENGTTGECIVIESSLWIGAFAPFDELCVARDERVSSDDSAYHRMNVGFIA